jgi:hemolysin III
MSAEPLHDLATDAEPEHGPHAFAEAAAHAVAATLRPVLRGKNHLAAFPLAILATLALVWRATDTSHAMAGAAFGTSVSLVLGMSAAYHNIDWPAGWARWARRADHAMIFVSIGGTYTALWMAELHGNHLADSLLVVAWVGAGLGVLYRLAWVDAPKLLSSIAYNVLGLSGLLVLPQLVHAAGLTPTLMLLASGLSLMVGAIVYTLERPNPLPHLFGFHEVFHLLVTLAFLIQFVTFALFLVR